ncbi:permease [Salinithrix halophila]|uniref:Permease n=1 Tax=Salinithrix halophila TaxID=1485204 RepID=A0ABV8JK16_9BACL
MVKWIREFSVELTGLLVLGGFLSLLFFGFETIQNFNGLEPTNLLPSASPILESWITLFLSIFIEGIPFILIGVLVSGLIQVYVKEEALWQFIPRRPWLSIPLATCMGLALPVCECGIVPVARRLIGKGLPPYIAFTFLLAAPVINPVTIFSTYLAFGNDWGMTVARVGSVAVIASLMGVAFLLWFSKDLLKEEKLAEKWNDDHSQQSPHGVHSHGHDCGHSHESGTGNRIHHALYHGVFEFMNMGKYFITGALIAAGFQTFIGLGSIRDFAQNEWLAILLMMGLAFGLSLCSSADAFVAASFRSALGNVPLLAFLVYGPMMDLKNILMMTGSFKKRVVLFFFGGTTLLTLFFAGIWIFFVS